MAGTRFRQPLSSAVKALKYRHARAVGAGLVGYLERPLEEIIGEAGRRNAVLVPIPLHASRERKRGHNQAAVLAELLSRRSGVPCRRTLQRVRATETQTELRRTERFANVAGAFAWSGPPARGAVILVDDVVTTGATFAAAARAVRTIGAPGIWGLAVAYKERG